MSLHAQSYIAVPRAAVAAAMCAVSSECIADGIVGRYTLDSETWQTITTDEGEPEIFRDHFEARAVAGMALSDRVKAGA